MKHICVLLAACGLLLSAAIGCDRPEPDDPDGAVTAEESVPAGTIDFPIDPALGEDQVEVAKRVLKQQREDEAIRARAARPEMFNDTDKPATTKPAVDPGVDPGTEPATKPADTDDLIAPPADPAPAPKTPDAGEPADPAAPEKPETPEAPVKPEKPKTDDNEFSIPG